MPIKNLFKQLTFQVFSPGKVLRKKYDAFKRLLDHDREAHNQLATLEEIYYNLEKRDFQAIAAVYGEFSASVLRMIDQLLIMSPSRYWSLKEYHKKFDFYVRFMLAPPTFDSSPPFVIDFGRIDMADIAITGEKAAVLARLNKDLHLPVPRGFVITTNAFHRFIEANGLETPINEKLAGLDIHDPVILETTADEIQKMFMDAAMPGEIESEIIRALEELKQNTGGEAPHSLRLALRSSAVKEDGPASFAGQYLSVMNLKETEIMDDYKKVLAGKYRPSALFYRISAGIADHDTPMAVLALEMKDAQAAGVMYTRGFEDQDTGRIIIHSTWGQGGLLVKGEVSPDQIRVDKTTQSIESLPGAKEKTMQLDPDTGTRIFNTEPKKQAQLSLDRKDILTLARWGEAIEDYFSHPQDIEWCKDPSGDLFLLQARRLIAPLPVSLPREKKPFQGQPSAPLCSGGRTICRGTGSGRVFRLTALNQLQEIPENAIVLADHALPQFVRAVHKMAGIIIRTGSTAGHFASIAREFGVPAMIGPENGREELKSGRVITLDAMNCRVYDDSLPIRPAAHQPRDDIFSNSDVMTTLRFVINFCAELTLTDPEAPWFKPEGCRSLHDIIRFVHETAMKDMFLSGQRQGSRKKGAKKLISPIPMLFYVLDAGTEDEAGTNPVYRSRGTLRYNDIRSLPMRAVLKGLFHPGICWDETRHFDWESYDRAVMAGGIISPDNPRFGSYAAVARTYANINLRFGYHFAVIDVICSSTEENNYIQFRFSGGGGSPEGRWLRARFIAGILERLDFMVTIKSDLIDGRSARAGQRKIETRLEIIGRLLGATKLMDMYLKDENDLGCRMDEFMNGRSDFRPGRPEEKE
ncbi:MAG TPA: PEP/pyruvate-binding domain-containing protein [Desulfobacteraceae bacterium]|nr:PEP/pyruvate-binding domain-containing protein [Desulfobacteraceae bacterium]